MIIFSACHSSSLALLSPDVLICFLLQIFQGNQNHDTPELKPVGPLLTRFVRIYPERATTEGLGLRLELLGCELDGECPAEKMSFLHIRIIDFNLSNIIITRNEMKSRLAL